VDGDRDILVGVLGHELGHLRHRHGMRMLVQAGTLGAATGALYGDFSSLFAQIPVLLGQASYSRDAEHEADVDAVRLRMKGRIDIETPRGWLNQHPTVAAWFEKEAAAWSDVGVPFSVTT